MKYFLTSLRQIASTLDDAEKKRVEKLTFSFENSTAIFHKFENN